MATVLKTVVGQLTVGSNPTPSAKTKNRLRGRFFVLVLHLLARKTPLANRDKL